MEIFRPKLVAKILDSMQEYPVTAILGPRQCGKTTVSRWIGKDFKSKTFDLDDPTDRQALAYSPKEILTGLEGLIIIDEIQRMPELFPVIRVIVDQMDNRRRKFLILGSASPRLVKESSESLAGRIGFIDMSGFNVEEIGLDHYRQLWFRGSFPLSYLAKSDEISYKWRGNFIRTFLERDIPQLGFNIPTENLRRFWMMIAHYHGQIWNAAEFGRSLGVSVPTAQRYFDILTGAYVVRQLQPWHENIGKRQVKSPKVYIRDSGILHHLLALQGDQIIYHPKLGSSWEGFVIEQVISMLELRDLYFWATHAGAELDLMLFMHGKRYGIEVKWSDAPGLSRSMVSSMESLKLEKLFVIYPGNKTYPLAKNIFATGWITFFDELRKLKESL